MCCNMDPKVLKTSNVPKYPGVPFKEPFHIHRVVRSDPVDSGFQFCNLEAFWITPYIGHAYG